MIADGAADPTQAPAWARLEALASTVGRAPIRALQDADPDRPSALTWACGPLALDLSRQRLTADVLDRLVDLAHQRHLPEVRDAMLRGEHVNVTEDRPALHTALRLPHAKGLLVDGADVGVDVHQVLDRMTVFAEQIRDGQWRGSGGARIRDVVNIGIGGSDLGPVMAQRALASFASDALAMHYVSNVDPADLDRVLRRCSPESTLFIVASKTFTTIETMVNARAARAWIVDALGPTAVPRHFAAVSTNIAEVAGFGIDPGNVFGFWEWVGGRYSMGSAIGLSTMIAIGPTAFREMLAGFADMDRHFATADLAANLPVLLGLVAVWNRNFLGLQTSAILPYSDSLARLPAYLQQLIMESNGKSVRGDGAPVDYATSPVIWGEPGTNGQHSFFQLLHQGTDVVPCDVIAIARPTIGRPDAQAAGSANSANSAHSIRTAPGAFAEGADVAARQDLLVANALAQAAVLSRGRTAQEVAADGTPAWLVPHKVMPGNRPVTVITIDELDPHTLGMLIALYEHSVFVQACVWGINPFDQWGVELGKRLALDVGRTLRDPSAPTHLDPSTLASIAWYRSTRV